MHAAVHPQESALLALAVRAPARSRNADASATMPKVTTSMMMPSTEIAARSPLSLRSKISTEMTLVSEVNRITAADSSRITATKTKHQVAITAGLDEARGQAVIVIDGDLQDPPELLPDMMALMDREGADVVYGQRRQRGMHIVNARHDQFFPLR